MSETKDRGKRIKEKYILLAKIKTPSSGRLGDKKGGISSLQSPIQLHRFKQ